MTTQTGAAPGKVRHYEFDMLKGVAIFMVVMGHVITMCVRGIDYAPVFKLIDKIHMPLFFFISGWFTFKLTAEGNVQSPDLLKRARQLLLPAVAVSTLWIFYFPHTGLESPLNSTFAGLWADTWKNGYWFTISLFEIMIIYALLTPLLSKIKSAVGCALLALAVWVVLMAIIALWGGEWAAWLSFFQTVLYFPAFMLGVFGRRFRDGFMRMVNSSVVQTIALILGGACLYFLYYRWVYGLTELADNILRALFHVFLAPVAMAVFGPWAARAYAPGASATSSLMARVWTRLGRESLGIYLLHYFFLFPMGGIAREWLTSVDVAFVPVCAFAVLAASLIVICTLGLIRIIRPSRILTLLLTGTYEKK